MKKIDDNLYRKYTALANGQELLNTLDDPSYCDRVNFHKANQAIEFLKIHTKDNQFEREAATTAIIMALDYLSEFESELKAIMIKGIADTERKDAINKKALIEARKLLEGSILPSLENLLAEIEKLNTIEGYSSTWLRVDLEDLTKRIGKAAGVQTGATVIPFPVG